MAEKKVRALRRLVDRFRAREDSEHEQAVIRVVIVLLVFGYVAAFGATLPESVRRDAFATIAAYEALAVACVLWIAAAPAVNPLRRFLGMVGDFGAMSLLMYQTGEVGTPLYPLYLWVVLGNGFRYGVRYLAVAVVLAVSGFAAVAMLADPWRDHGLLTAGLLMGLIIIPAYAAALIRKLTEAKAQAEAANQAKSRFLAIVSHELRTPLNAIIGMSDLLRASRLGGEERDMARTIHLSGEALLSLIDSVLDFSRIEAGKTVVTEADVDLHRSVADLFVVLRPQAREKGLRLSVTLSADIPAHVVADWPHIRQILINLVSNALKFTRAGGVSLRVLREDAGDREHLVFEVEDTGVGIAPGKLEHIFESFTQADDSVNRRFGGAGLGLTISRQLAELMGGTITVRSRVGEGSCFRVTLPLRIGPVEARPSEPLAATVVVDDARLVPVLDGLAARVVPLREEAEVADCLRTVEGAFVLVLAHRASDRVMALAEERQVPVVLVGADRTVSPPPLVTAPGEPSPERLANAVRACRRFMPNLSADAGSETENPADFAVGRPLHILVAEDNAVNVKVVGKILEKAGHSLEVVGTGDDLLDAMGRGGFDVVLADVNMPGTPVTDVVKLFRMAHLEEPRLPIIALSADATLETRRLCEEAGVDAYLTKPVVANTLLATIADLVGRVETTPVSEGNLADLTAHPDFNGPSRSPVDREALDRLVELGDRTFVRELSQDFIQDAKGLIDAMEEAVRAGDWTRFRSQCHALRSSSANVGARGIARLCHSAGGVDPKDAQAHGLSLCARARGELLRYRAEMARYLDGDERSNTLLF